MKNSLRPARAGNAVARLPLLVLAAILSCAGPIVSAQQYSLAGEWRTSVQTGTITITFEANGQYNQMSVTKAGTAEAQDGPYQLVAPNSIIFRVTDWSPKSKLVLVPCGIPGDPTCNVQREQSNSKPPDSEYAYTFNGPNTLMLKNQAGSYTFTRVATQ